MFLQTMIKMDEDEDTIQDDSIYSEEKRKTLLEEDGLSPEEAAFMQGYEDAM